MITRQDLVDRDFKNGDVHGQYRKFKSIDQWNSFILDIQIKDDGTVKYIDLDCEVDTTSDHFSSSLSLPINAPIEDIDHLIRILKL